MQTHDPSTVSVPRLWLAHAAALVLPLATLGFVATGPHGAAGAPVLLALPLLLAVDRRAAHEPPVAPPGWAFDAILYALVAVQLATIALALRSVAIAGFGWDVPILIQLVGNNTGWGAVVVAHELVHRRGRVPRWLGRALLWTALYDHFHVEHVRGHHVRVATADDPATARFGERLLPFLRRSIVGQLRSAWRIDRRQVLVGAAIQLTLLVAIGAGLGLAALVTFVGQAVTAISLLETVNYFEHWGLGRTTPRVRDAESWDTDCLLTRYSMVGLALHADHHARPQRPFQALRPSAESPKLPYGYFRMVYLAQVSNDRFQALMTAELRRRALGPFAVAAR